MGNGKKARNCNPVAPSLHLPHSLTIQLALFREDLFLLISLTRVALQSGVGVTLALVHALLLCARTTPIRRSSFVFFRRFSCGKLSEGVAVLGFFSARSRFREGVNSM